MSLLAIAIILLVTAILLITKSRAVAELFYKINRTFQPYLNRTLTVSTVRIIVTVLGILLVISSLLALLTFYA